jgi:hypothetical protein
MEVAMAGMPNPKEDSDDVGGAAQRFKEIEKWLNNPDPPETKQNNRIRARNAVAGDFAGVTTQDYLPPVPPAPTLSRNPGINHFNKHWRGGPSGWWPNIPKARIDSEMSKAFAAALDTVLAPGQGNMVIRLRWDCSELNVNATASAFRAFASPPKDGVVWIDIVSPRAP